MERRARLSLVEGKNGWIPHVQGEHHGRTVRGIRVNAKARVEFRTILRHYEGPRVAKFPNVAIKSNNERKGRWS